MPVILGKTGSIKQDDCDPVRPGQKTKPDFQITRVLKKAGGVA
jgi:hypothetical protein